MLKEGYLSVLLSRQARQPFQIPERPQGMWDSALAPAACRSDPELALSMTLGNVLRSEKQVAFGIPKLQRQPKKGGSKHTLWVIAVFWTAE